VERDRVVAAEEGLMAHALLLLSLFCDVTAAPKMKEAVIEATALDTWYGKPPLKKHRFDVKLRNPSPERRWLILPATFPYAGQKDPAPGGAETEMQVFQLSAEPYVLFIRGVAGHFQTVSLPGNATLVLRRLEIESWWDDVPKSAEIEVIVAREIRVGDETIEDSLGSTDVESHGGADVKAPSGAADPRARRFWHRTRGSATLQFDVESRAKLKVKLR
jgi:hypothetical protein